MLFVNKIKCVSFSTYLSHCSYYRFILNYKKSFTSDSIIVLLEVFNLINLALVHEWNYFFVLLKSATVECSFKVGCCLFPSKIKVFRKISFCFRFYFPKHSFWNIKFLELEVQKRITKFALTETDYLEGIYMTRCDQSVSLVARFRFL